MPLAFERRDATRQRMIDLVEGLSTLADQLDQGRLAAIELRDRAKPDLAAVRQAINDLAELERQHLVRTEKLARDVRQTIRLLRELLRRGSS